MRHSARRLKKRESGDGHITIYLMPFGLFAIKGGSLIRKEVWDEKDAPKNYLAWKDAVKKFKSKLALKEKYTIKRIFGADAEKFAKDYSIKFNFQKFMIGLTKLRIKEGFSKDKLISQASNMLDGTNKMINIFYERLMEWYGYYWPENFEKIDSVGDFLERIGEKRSGQSMGFDFDKEDLNMLHTAGDELESLVLFRQKISKYIENLMDALAPNTSKVAGALIGAKLIASAGGIKKIAEMPSIR